MTNRCLLTSAFVASTAYGIKGFQNCASAECRELDAVSQLLLCILALIKHGLGTLQCLCQWLHKCYVDKSTSWCTKQPLSANDFARFVSEYGLWYLLFCKIGFATKFLISPAAFHLCGLRKVRRIEFLFLPLDWIYYFILEVTAKEYCIILISHRPCPVN